MKPSELLDYLVFSIENNFPVMITGAPGIGKSDIVEQACDIAKVRLLTSHPVVADPTDYKGLPFPNKDGTAADFLPYGDLDKLVKATEKTVFFLDDLGQASTSVQAACMQLVLARRINGHKISDDVIFFAATNRKQDKAGVTGIIEPVKSRFNIQELTINVKDWSKWAYNNNMPHELIAFINFQPNLLLQHQPTTDISNSSCPRTIATVGRNQTLNCPQHLFYDCCKGSAGEAFARQYIAFLKLFDKLPTVDSILLNPTSAKIPPTLDSQYAFIVALARRMTDTTIVPICEYLKRLTPELSVCCMKMATARDNTLQETQEFAKWAANISEDLL